jgi:ribosome biogenesis SPOUT family RNA methylase Rps3
LVQIPWVDFPELRLGEQESVEMPFRYVKGADGQPVMPEGMIDLIKSDADKSLEDIL